MKILVTGANGQLGKSIQKAVANDELSNEFVFVGRSELDLSQNDNFEKYFKKIVLMLWLIVQRIQRLIKPNLK